MRRLVAACFCTILGFVVVLALLPLGAIERLELLTLDARYQSGLARKAPGADVVIAWIDQESMDYVEQEGGFSWPWPRDVYAPVVAYLREAGARAVAFDLLFDQRGAAAGDSEFGAALAAGTGDALAMKFVDFRAGGRDDGETAAFAARGRGGELGFVNIRPDADKTFRRYDLLRAWGPAGQPANVYPSLAAAAALAANLVTADDLAARLRSTPDARLLLNFRGPAYTFAKVKFINILLSMQRAEAGEAPLYAADLFRDKIVLVGIHAEGYEDAHQTPLAERFPGVELHATALDNLLRDDALRAPSWDLPLAAAAATLATAAVFLLPGATAPLLALLALALAGLGGILLGWSALLAVPVAAPALAGGTAAASAFLHRIVIEGRQKRELRRAFQSYLAPEVLHEILRDPAALQLGGEQREVTLLFSDLQGFTGLAEHTSPQQLVAFLNDYFTRMCAPLLAERGVIDKFIGDAIMAFFGAPSADPAHGLAAVRAAVRAQQIGESIAAEAAARGAPPIRTRIGVHSGPAVVGNMGSADRFDYTAIGDTVNLASRLEGANKAFGTNCLVSASTWAMVGDAVIGRQVGALAVVGRGEPVRVYEPLALREQATAEQVELGARWAEALAAFAKGHRDAARTAMTAIATSRPDDRLAAIWRDRLADPAFDGTFRLDSK